MGKSEPFDKKLLEFATDRERVLLETWASEGTQTKAAKVLQITQHSISGAYKRTLKRAEIRGYSPQHKLQHAVPATQLLKGASTLYNDICRAPAGALQISGPVRVGIRNRQRGL